jgi:precorrin-6Y C5,15-methyltransferase (decarboxylating)
VDNKKMYVVGVGPGNVDLVTPAAMKLIGSCDVLIGGKRNLKMFENINTEKVVIGSDLELVLSYIRKNIYHKTIAVLATGDPGIFSIADYLGVMLPDIQMEIVPGISSLQYFCSRIGAKWNDMAIVSLHGRKDSSLAAVVRANRKTAIFTGGGISPAGVCRYLARNGIHDVIVTVGERLSYPDEKIISGTVDKISSMEFDSLALMMVQWEIEPKSFENWKYKTPGIPDELFIRGDIPMTKEEVRTAALSKLRLMEDSIIFDIGAGTGSVSVECGLLCRNGRVYSVERNKEAVKLIRENLSRFDLDNVIVIEGSAPEALNNLPAPDRVFIGGTGGHIDTILEWIAKNEKETRVVVNAISPETAYEALKGFEKAGFGDVEIINVAVSKGFKAGNRHIMKAINPIYIISAQKDGVK